EVAALGPDANGVAVGDEVSALADFRRDGAAADSAVVAAARLAAKPRSRGAALRRRSAPAPRTQAALARPRRERRAPARSPQRMAGPVRPRTPRSGPERPDPRRDGRAPGPPPPGRPPHARR